jgi:hypothetical protein
MPSYLAGTGGTRRYGPPAATIPSRRHALFLNMTASMHSLGAYQLIPLLAGQHTPRWIQTALDLAICGYCSILESVTLPLLQPMLASTGEPRRYLPSS